MAGNGGIVCRPDSRNDADSIWFSQTGWTATGATNLPVSTDVGVGASLINSSYTTADFTNNVVSSRCVGIGVRVRYIGTRLNAGGRVYSLEHPDHHTLAADTVAQLRAFDSCEAWTFDEDWVTCLYQPRFPEDFEYFSDGFGQSENAAFLAISIQSADATAPFEWEVYSHWEFIGSSVRGKTVSHSAPNESDRVISALSQAPPSVHRAVALKPERALQIAHAAVNKGSSLWSTIGDVVTGGAAGYKMGGPLGALAGGVGGLLNSIL